MRQYILNPSSSIQKINRDDFSDENFDLQDNKNDDSLTNRLSNNQMNASTPINIKRQKTQITNQKFVDVNLNEKHI